MRALSNDELRWVSGGYYDSTGTWVEEIVVIGERNENDDTYSWDDFFRDNPDLFGDGNQYSDGSGRDDSGGGSSSDPAPDPAIKLNAREFGIGATFASPEDAMRDALKRVQAKSLSENKEIAGVVKTDGAGGYYVDDIWLGDEDGVGPREWRGEAVLSFHTHANVTDANNDGRDDYKSNEFSTEDKAGAEHLGVDEYMLAPDGTIYKYDVDTNAVSTFGNVSDPIPAPTAPPPG